MAELDYAYLADYAKAENGKLTAVGASYAFVKCDQIPTNHTLVVAGRIRALLGEEPNLVIRANSPENSIEIKFEVLLNPQNPPRPYNGYVGVLFAVTGPLPIFEVGLYTISIEIDDKVVRTLKFEAELASQSA